MLISRTWEYVPLRGTGASAGAIKLRLLTQGLSGEPGVITWVLSSGSEGGVAMGAEVRGRGWTLLFRRL